MNPVRESRLAWGERSKAGDPAESLSQNWVLGKSYLGSGSTIFLLALAAGVHLLFSIAIK